MEDKFSRRSFLYSVSMLAAGTTLAAPLTGFGMKRKLRVVLVGTGVRGTSFWGKRLVDEYSDILEFVGLSDINPGRLAYGKTYMNVNCPTFVDYDEMLDTTKPDLIIVTTMDSTHHEFIIKGLEFGCDVLTEKPLTTDEYKCQQILDAERKSDKNLIVGFNYRWSPYMTKIKELLQNKEIGEITSVDFHWYLNTHHGASYFRRWHGVAEAFNGQKGRIDAWLDIPFLSNETMDQEALHAAEMDQNLGEDMHREPLVLHKNWEEPQIIQVVSERGGHGGGDKRLHDKIFKNPEAADPYKHSAGLRDGIMSVLVGVAARNSIHSNQPVRIEDLSDIKPSPDRA
ncbi:MAG: Gfo/Idh/MocA family oxidoreductase [Cyclobacteriaceae bacterium]